MNVRMYRVLMLVFAAALVALCGFAPPASAAGTEKGIAVLLVNRGEHKKLRVDVNKNGTKDEVAYIEVEASNGLTSGTTSVSGPVVVQDWGSSSCTGSYKAYNTFGQIIYSWQTTQSYSRITQFNTSTIYLRDYSIGYEAYNGWRYDHRTYTTKGDQTSYATAKSQGFFVHVLYGGQWVLIQFDITGSGCSVYYATGTW